MNVLKGYRTYIVSLGIIIAAITAWQTGDLTLVDAVTQGLQGLGLATLRAAVK